MAWGTYALAVTVALSATGSDGPNVVEDISLPGAAVIAELTETQVPCEDTLLTGAMVGAPGCLTACATLPRRARMVDAPAGAVDAELAAARTAAHFRCAWWHVDLPSLVRHPARPTADGKITRAGCPRKLLWR